MDQLVQQWLFILCTLVQDVTRAIVFLPVPGKDGYQPSACWPENLTEYQDLTASAGTSLTNGKCIVLHNTGEKTETGEPFEIVACPLLLDEKIHGVVVLQMAGRVPAKQQVVVQQVEEAVVWFGVLFRQRSSTEKKQLINIVDLVASCLEHERFQAAATDMLSDLTTRLACDRVSIGLLHGHTVKVEAVSHNAAFDNRSSLIRDIGEAMDEAIDQNSTIVYPEPTDSALLTRCHAVLAEEHKIGTILTVPLVAGGGIAGAVLAERPFDRPFDQATREHFQDIVSMIGPVLVVRYREEQWLPIKIRNSLKSSLVKVIGPGRIGLKLGLAAAVLCLILLSVINADYRITGDARLEARTQRVIVAPQNGYIAGTNVRPGDIIHYGEVLATLDDKDLQLEHRKWSSQLEQQQREYRDALANHDRSKVSIINAKILQARAQLNLVGEQLTRTRFTAPFDGIIVSGDLSQALGSPVQRGQVLFTVAPLVAYRVILQVDERDIGSVKEGQSGNLVLSGMPRTPLLFTVEKITPVSTAEGGRNFFKVEAKMKETSDLFRPGMEGVAKINIDRRKLIWIWTHKLVDWWRLTLWSIRP